MCVISVERRKRSTDGVGNVLDRSARRKTELHRSRKVVQAERSRPLPTHTRSMACMLPVKKQGVGGGVATGRVDFFAVLLIMEESRQGRWTGNPNALGK